MKSKAVEEGRKIIKRELPYCLPSSLRIILKALQITDNSVRADERRKMFELLKQTTLNKHTIKLLKKTLIFPYSLKDLLFLLQLKTTPSREYLE